MRHGDEESVRQHECLERPGESYGESSSVGENAPKIGIGAVAMVVHHAIDRFELSDYAQHLGAGQEGRQMNCTRLWSRCLRRSSRNDEVRDWLGGLGL